MPERTPEEAAELALRVTDETLEGVMDRLRIQARQQAVAAILGDHQYAVGSEVLRRMSWPEDAVFDAVTQAAEILGDDSYMAWEDAFHMDQRLLDTIR